MVGGNKITDKQLEKLALLQTRKDGHDKGLAKYKPLTKNMENDLADLIAKRDAPFELGATAKSFIAETWLEREHGYKEPMESQETLKGKLCEQDSIRLVAKKFDASFRRINKQNFKNDFFTGTPDIILEDIRKIEDVKTSWSIKTYNNVKDLDPLYFGQGQVYMDILSEVYGKPFHEFAVHYCLVDTPPQMITDMKMKFFYKYGNDEENEHYIEACKQIDRNHVVSHLPFRTRIKTFEFERNKKYIAELKRRMPAAREFYKSQVLGGFVKKITWGE